MEIFNTWQNAENWYYLVKWTSGSYTLQYSHNIVRDVIKAGELMCDAEYLNPFDYFKQSYITYEKSIKNNCQVE